MAEANPFDFSRVAGFSPEERAAFLVSGLNARPENIQELEIPGGDSNGKVRKAVASLFDRLEGNLDSSDISKVRALFDSPEAGYAGYALPMLHNGNIDPNNLPEGSAPLWESREAALAELLGHLTSEMLEVIQRDYKEPAIVIEPIRSPEAVYVKNASEKGYDRRVLGTTPFFVSEWSESYLDRVNSDQDHIGSMDGNKIVGWSIGIVDKAQVTKVLATDGNVTVKTLKDRARDFHGQGGHGQRGFVSVMDRPGLYGLMMNHCRQGDDPQPIDDVAGDGGVWTMGTNLDESGQYPRVAGGLWSCNLDQAYLGESNAAPPLHVARVRLAMMFKKA
jgi:hypothetical protein